MPIENTPSKLLQETKGALLQESNDYILIEPLSYVKRFSTFFDATPTGRVKYGASTSSDDNIVEFDATPTGRAREN